MSILLDGTGGVTTPGVVNTAGETIATTLSVTGVTTLTGTLSAANNVTIYDATLNTPRVLSLNSNRTSSGVLGTIRFGNAQFNNNEASIVSESDGAIDAARLMFSTTPTSGSITERMRITSTGLLQFNSGYGSVATAYGCRAWVNFNGTGTVAIRASGNVSSITDGGVGTYTVNFTTAMVDTNYSVSGVTSLEGTYAASNVCTSTANTTSGAVIYVNDYNSPSRCDQNGVYISIFR